MPAAVSCAGGVGLGPEFALVHRPRYDDWTFPKGKAEDGESDEENAEREVREETGLRCERGPEVATIDYHGPPRPPEDGALLADVSGGGRVRAERRGRRAAVGRCADRCRPAHLRPRPRACWTRRAAFDRAASTSCATRRPATATRGPRTTSSVRSRRRGRRRRRGSWRCSRELAVDRCCRAPPSGACRPCGRWRSTVGARSRSRRARRGRAHRVGALARPVAGGAVVMCSHGDVIPAIVLGPRRARCRDARSARLEEGLDLDARARRRACSRRCATSVCPE